ncbi:MAG TPA: ribosome biogenesis GTPase RsgA [Sedimenticola thiotaurini]|uniref:Ribosome biogenesis GTPase RsgA n=1 Tax=Sedimenticola thiotaurini TaxID=1543721 RepID=A0A831RL40_9GAMM|nr:ribosome biogenesis GTPase RsgA [Sedimenticola thiotaurini]
MQHRSRRLSTVILVSGLLLAGGNAPARSPGGGGYQSLDSAVSGVRQRSGGRVLSAETRQEEGRPVHYIRLLTPDGRVRRVRIDARSGRRLGPRER